MAFVRKERERLHSRRHCAIHRRARIKKPSRSFLAATLMKQPFKRRLEVEICVARLKEICFEQSISEEEWSDGDVFQSY